MPQSFQSTWWQIAVPLPWQADECEACVEFTQPEGVGALHISGIRKTDGDVLDAEVLSELRNDCPGGIETQIVHCGDFVGYCAEHVDGATSFYWKKWLVACRKILLFATYNCKHGEEGLEAPQVSALLASL